MQYCKNNNTSNFDDCQNASKHDQTKKQKKKTEKIN